MTGGCRTYVWKYGRGLNICHTYIILEIYVGCSEIFAESPKSRRRPTHGAGAASGLLKSKGLKISKKILKNGPKKRRLS